MGAGGWIAKVLLKLSGPAAWLVSLLIDKVFNRIIAEFKKWQAMKRKETEIKKEVEAVIDEHKKAETDEEKDKAIENVARNSF
jgi:biopolymer transport protein ExbB/TolQ